ncbi:MAG TPA: TetR/AcrR family transcriptional regulator [Longimicrobiales bacterium]|nr:TetR/AcrR family transcriptional regulator [Longimicrobiales bacterium]
MMNDPSPTPLRPPKQPRSRRTLERIVRAALEILEEEGPEALTVLAVVGRAGSSVGSFYARFAGKDDLLQYLSGRVLEESLEAWSRALGGSRGLKEGVREGVRGAAELLVDIGRSPAGRLRSLDGALGGAGTHRGFLDRVLEDLEQALLRYRESFAHEDPELAVRLGLRAVLGVVESAGAVERSDPLSRDTLVEEGGVILTAYLCGAPGGGSEQEVEFFDVWG